MAIKGFLVLYKSHRIVKLQDLLVVVSDRFINVLNTFTAILVAARIINDSVCNRDFGIVKLLLDIPYDKCDTLLIALSTSINIALPLSLYIEVYISFSNCSYVKSC